MTKYHYLPMDQYFSDENAGLLQAGDGATVEKDGVLFEQLVKIEDDSAIVWVAWDDMDRSGMRSYIDYREARKLGLVPFAL